MIAAANLAARLADLAPIGLGERGTNRLAWTEEAAAAEAWFRSQAEGLGATVQRDPAGNLWAAPDAPPPWWGAGSHLDSVRDGGRHDGALGVAAAFEVAARSRVPVAVLSFADEEGARFNTPTFGSRALVGRLDVADALGRRDDDGVRLADALTAAGVDPDGLDDAPAWLGRLRGLLELHIDQSREVASGGGPVGVASGLASRLRLRGQLTGRADHAGSTPRAERRDALAAAARLIVAADELGGDEPGLVTTASRILVEPNALTTVPARVTLYLDARAPEPDALHAWRSALEAAARSLAESAGVQIALETAAESTGVSFDPDVRAALEAAASRVAGRPSPAVLSYAGHDAGVIAERLPAGMVLVRNATGVSHAPDEHVELADAALAAEVLLTALEQLA